MPTPSQSQTPYTPLNNRLNARFFPSSKLSGTLAILTWLLIMGGLLLPSFFLPFLLPATALTPVIFQAITIGMCVLSISLMVAFSHIAEYFRLKKLSASLAASNTNNHSHEASTDPLSSTAAIHRDLSRTQANIPSVNPEPSTVSESSTVNLVPVVNSAPSTDASALTADNPLANTTGLTR